MTLLVEGGRTKRAIHTFSGAPGTITPSGRYEVFRKELQSWSVPFQTWLPYASYFNNGIAFHEYPDVPDLPGVARMRPRPRARGQGPLQVRVPGNRGGRLLEADGGDHRAVVAGPRVTTISEVPSASPTIEDSSTVSSSPRAKT